MTRPVTTRDGTPQRLGLGPVLGAALGLVSAGTAREAKGEVKVDFKDITYRLFSNLLCVA